MLKISKLVTDGQPGTGQSVLSFAWQHDINYENLFPVALTKDSITIPDTLKMYSMLRAGDLADHGIRARKNVQKSDLTLIIQPSGVTSSQINSAIYWCMRNDHYSYVSNGFDVDNVVEWLDSHSGNFPEGAILNVVGPRKSEYKYAFDITTSILFGVYSS